VYTPRMAMAWLILNPDTAALFVRRALQAALDKEPRADVIHTEVNVLLYETPQAQPRVAVTVGIPETDTARSLLNFLRAGEGAFERLKTSAGNDYYVAGCLGREIWLKIQLLGDGLLHIDVETRGDFTMRRA
jgi:hypothetical protein